MMNDISGKQMIIDKIIKEIKNDKYLKDDKLPSDNTLSKEFNIPRIEVRKGYETLETMGYVYSLQGRGRFVMERNKEIKLTLTGDESFSKKLEECGYNVETINIFCEKIDYIKEIYDKLNAIEEEEVYKIGRLRLIDNEPVAIHISYVRREIFNDINEVGHLIKSIFDYYKEKGFSVFKSEECLLSIDYPDYYERKFLEAYELSPILRLKTNCIDLESNTVLEYTEAIYRGDKFSYGI